VKGKSSAARLRDWRDVKEGKKERGKKKEEKRNGEKEEGKKREKKRNAYKGHDRGTTILASH